MAIEKSAGNPLGQDVSEQQLQDKKTVESLYELEVDDPDAPRGQRSAVTETDDGGLEFDFAPRAAARGEVADLSGAQFDDNLAPLIPEAILDELAMDLVEKAHADRDSMDEWVSLAEDGMDLLGFRLDDETDFPFDGACTATHPMLAEAIIKYQSKARSKLMPPQGPVRTKVMGKDDPVSLQKALRVREYANYQIQEKMTEYEPVHDRLLFIHAFYGMCYTKLYWDAARNRIAVRLVPPHKLWVDYNADSLETADMHTELVELSGYEYQRKVEAGYYMDGAMIGQGTEDTRIDDKEDELVGRNRPDYSNENYKIYEIHCYLSDAELGLIPDDESSEDEESIMEDGKIRPYIVCIDSNTDTIISVHRNWMEDDPTEQKIEWYQSWPFIPGFGFQGYGYLHLIGGLAKVSTTTLRQLVDAGTFANLQGGFKAHGLRVVGDDEPFAPGEWKDVNAPGQDLQKALLPLPYKEPSQTLVSLLQFVVEASQKFADSTEQVVSESTNYGPVGTTMALLEASGRMFNAIHERLYNSQKKQLRMLFKLNVKYGQGPYPYIGQEGPQTVIAEDFKSVNILPEADPRVPTEAHRIAKTQAQLQIAQQFPQQHNIPTLLHRMHAALGEDDPQDVLAPPPQQQQPRDPVTENQTAIQGLPPKSAEWQDHESHIKVHVAFLNDPNIAKNPTISQVLMPHIYEHLGQYYRLRVQEQIGQELPPLEQSAQMPPEVQNQIAMAVAQAADELLANTKDLIMDVSNEQIMRSPQFQLAQFEADTDRLKVIEDEREGIRDYERQKETAAMNAVTQANIAGVEADAGIQRALITEQQKGVNDYEKELVRNKNKPVK